MAKQELSKVKEVKAFARYIHVSPRKLRLVAALVKKSPVDVALEQLQFSSKNAALPLAKAINSAIANALHNFNLNRENLYVKAITIDGGPVYKTYAPRAQGRAFTERKRTSHINVVLEARANKAPKRRAIFSRAPKTQDEAKIHSVQPEAGSAPAKHNAPKQAPRASDKIKQNTVNLKRRLFNRKSGE